MHESIEQGLLHNEGKGESKQQTDDDTHRLPVIAVDGACGGFALADECAATDAERAANVGRRARIVVVAQKAGVLERVVDARRLRRDDAIQNTTESTGPDTHARAGAALGLVALRRRRATDDARILKRVGRTRRRGASARLLNCATH